MNSKLIRHQRILVVRELILHGKNRDELREYLLKMGVDRGTAQSYINEAVEDIKKRIK